MTKADVLKAICLPAVLQLVAACAALPPPQDLTSGKLPAGPAASFVMAKTGPDLSPQSIAAIGECLGRAGMAPGETPAYFVQLAHTLRAGKTQVLIPDPATPVPAAKPTHRRKGTLESLTLTVSDIQAQEIFRASVTQFVRDKPDAAGTTSLTDHLCRVLATQK